MTVFENNRYTIGFIRHDEKVFESYLGPSLEKLKGNFDIITTTNEKNPAENYNEIIEKSPNDFIILLHEDMSFTSDLLERLDLTNKTLNGKWSSIGVVGSDYESLHYKNNWSNDQTIFECSTLDCCFILINKLQNIKFDTITFDEYHLYVEDYCLQARKHTGLGSFTMLMNSHDTSKESDISHYGAITSKLGPAWGNYASYKRKLLHKWPNASTT